MYDDVDTQITTTCMPYLDPAPLQSIDVTAHRNDVVVGTLIALRYATFGYDPAEQADEILHAFDLDTASAYGLAEELKRRRRIIGRMSDAEMSCGLIGILELQVVPAARGTGVSKALVDELRLLHAGMSWNVALQAVPIEFKEGPEPEFRAMRSRLIGHYARMGFERPSPRGSPELMVAFWHG